MDSFKIIFTYIKNLSVHSPELLNMYRIDPLNEFKF